MLNSCKATLQLPLPLLLLLLPLAVSLLTPCSNNYTEISVSEDGIDSPNCTNGTTAGVAMCRTLSYALHPASLMPCTRVSISGNITLRDRITVFNISDLVVRGNITSQPWVRVECGFGAGIAFEGVSGVLVSYLFWKDCSVGFAFSDSTSENITLRTALYFIYGKDISIRSCKFTSSRGSGICMNNVEGTVNVIESMFLDNNLLDPCSNNESCYNQSIGLQVLGLNMSNSVYNITDCTFEGNDNMLSASFTRDQDTLSYRAHRTVSHGGGLEIRLTGNSSYNKFTIEDCQFTENMALWGAGMEVGIGEDSEYNSISVNHSTFLRNYGLTGGGLRLTLFPSVNYDGYGTEDRDNAFIVSDCNFIANTAESSAGLSYLANRQLSRVHSSHLIITNSNFTENVANVSGAAVGLTAWNNEIGGYPTYANITDCAFVGNSIHYEVDKTNAYGIGVVFTEGVMLRVANSKFSRNFGTALVVSSTTVVLAGKVLFDENFGVSGGALHLMGLSWITLGKGLELTFRDNIAFLSGGAVFASFYIPQPILDTRFCIIEYEDPSTDESHWNVTVNFTNNTAKLSGPSIFLSTPGGCFRDNNTIPFSNSRIFHYQNSTAVNQTSTPPQSIAFGHPAVVANGSFTTQVMLGQPLKIKPLTVDVFNQSTVGSAVLQIYCTEDGVACNRTSVYSLVGQDLLQLDNNPLVTSFYLTGPESSEEEPFLLFLSNSFPSATGFLHLNVTPCHLGYVYSSDERMCTCFQSDYIYCGVVKACIKYGYWTGMVNGKMTYSNCPSGNCGYVNGRCPTSSCNEAFQSFCQLPETNSNELCSANRGGILCTSCSPGYSFSFGAVQCVPHDKCSAGNTALLVFLNVAFWVVLIAILVLVLKLHLRIGSGQLYCLIYYFGVLQYLTVNEFPSVFLTAVVYLCGGFLELDPRFLGLIDRCFLPDLNNLGHQVLRYVNPLFLALVVLLVVGITRLWPRFSTISKQNYSVRALCILLYLSFTALSETSLQILSFIKFQDVPGVYVKIEPTVRYFDPVQHLPYALVAIFVEVFIVIPFLFLILFAPWLARVPWINLTRIKPIIDEYQGCYRDSCRWFAGYYLLCRQLVFLFSLVDLGEFGGIFFLQQISIVILIIHAAARPYKKTWLNILDIILLGDLAIYSLFNGSTANVVLGDTRAFRDAIVHILILVPLIYFLGICCLKLFKLVYTHYQGGNHLFTLSTTVERNKFANLDSLSSSSPNSNSHGATLEREPLIFDSVDPQPFVQTRQHGRTILTSDFLVDSESERSSLYSATDQEMEAESQPAWYKRVSWRLTNLKGSKGSQHRRREATPSELTSSAGTVAKDVRDCPGYTTSEVTISTEDK